jgi:Flp pilus assembly protein TadD
LALRNHLAFVAALVLCVVSAERPARAGDLRINVPKRSVSTPVQRLNQQGVEAIRKHQYDQAKAFFYRAYLFDPDDPFTLNNLAYVAELEGQVQRAQTFYDLASQQASDAVVDRASTSRFEGRSLRDAISGTHDASVAIDRDNVEAVRLLSEGRAPEADSLLQKTLELDPRNPFTLNNIGVTNEMEGNFAEAFNSYIAAADIRSNEPIVVTLNGESRGQPISQVAASSARKLRQRMQTLDNPKAQAKLLNLRGVLALNRNDRRDATQDFQQAFKLDPTSAFSLNNLGYLSEMDGDIETAQFFYEKARAAAGANARIGVATTGSAVGQRLSTIADDSDQKVDATIRAEQEAKRKQQAPIELKHRDHSPVLQPPAPPEQ